MCEYIEHLNKRYTSKYWSRSAIKFKFEYCGEEIFTTLQVVMKEFHAAYEEFAS